MNWENILESDVPITENIWRFDPVDFRTFVESEDFCDSCDRTLPDKPSWSEEQFREVEKLVGIDPKLLFTTQRMAKLAVFLWGKGCLSKGTVITDVITNETKTVQEWCRLGKGIHVRSYDEKTGEIKVVESLPVYCKGEDDIYRVMVFGNGTTSRRCFYVTKQHQVYTENGWKKVENIKVGDKIYIDSNHLEHQGNLVLVEVKSIDWIKRDKYYDFTVPRYHNYFLDNGTLHHNSGKGTCASTLGLYIAYVLMCMKDFHSVFHVAKEDPISIVNVALSGPQSNRFFERVVNRIVANKWFKRFKVIKQGKVEPGTGTDPTLGDIVITGSTVKFPQNLQVLSLHSQQEKWEDLTIIFFLADEMCLSSDTLIEDRKTGVTRTIKDWYERKEGFFVKAFDFDKKISVLEKTQAPFYTGVQKVYEVITESGKKIKVSRNHKFYTPDGWKTLNELKNGDKIATME